jgi:hypothetical protein
MLGATLFTGSIVVGIVGVAIIGISYMLSPREYEISKGTLWIKRAFWSIGIPLHDIREVRAGTRNDLSGCIRVFGNGGLFGYYGIFRTSALGVCSWYVTNRAKAVILITRTKTMVLSPDDGSLFVEMVSSLSPVSASEGIHHSERSAESRRNAIRWNAIGIAIVLAMVLFGITVWFYSPGPPRCTINPGGLTIHDRLYPVTLRAADIDVPGIRVVDIGTDPHWRPVMRTNGFANMHYRAGWFKVAGGEKIRMYRTDSKQLVLLPPKNDTPPVLLEVPSPETFVKEVQNAWQ